MMSGARRERYLRLAEMRDELLDEAWYEAFDIETGYLHRLEQAIIVEWR